MRKLDDRVPRKKRGSFRKEIYINKYIKKVEDWTAG